MLYSMFLALFRRCKVPKRAVSATIVAGSFVEGCHVSALQDVRFVEVFFASKILFLDFMKVNPPAKYSSSFLWRSIRRRNALPRFYEGQSASEMLFLVFMKVNPSAKCSSSIL